MRRMSSCRTCSNGAHEAARLVAGRGRRRLVDGEVGLVSWTPSADLSYQAKQLVLVEYWQRYGPFRFIVETGVWQGNGSCMRFAQQATQTDPGSEYVGVELDRGSAELAWRRGFDVRVGDSAELLPGLLAARNGPAFFWLDAHLVVEAYERNHSPLRAELAAILAWPHAAGSVVLIDDVRMMGRDGWPGLRELLEQAYVRPGLWQVELREDILRLTPRIR